MIVVGGTYLETCEFPAWRRLFGSGCRAAAALGWLSPGTSLHTYAHHGWTADVEASMRACGVLARVTPIEDAIRFAYFHPLSPPRLTPPIPKANASLAVEGEVVLRFGFVEGDAIVHAERAVHDPQGGDLAAYRSNGSSAGTLAVVLNQHEAEQIAGGYGPDAGETVRGLHGAEVVVVKRGSAGALVHRADRPPVAIPAYPSERVFKIGSGDVFSAVFAHHWAERNLDPADAAELASRAVARYGRDPFVAVGTG